MGFSQEVFQIKTLKPFSWYGGKLSHLKWLLPVIDGTPHQTYIEPFGGSGAVVLNKKPSKVDVYNDIYSDVVNFFRVLRNQKDELIELLELTPYSREEFAEACEGGGSDLEKARKFFVKARQVRSGLATVGTQGKWSYGLECSRRHMGICVSRWLSGIDGLEEIYHRLRTIQIENLDGLELIKRYDFDNALFYVDPPYVLSSRTGGKAYKNEFSDEKHLELINILNTLKGKFILSGYENDIYNGLKGFKYQPEAKISAATMTNKVGKLRQEIIWTNYELTEEAKKYVS